MTPSLDQLHNHTNKLAVKYNFALLCGYSMGSFYKESKKLEQVIAQHTSVVPPDANVIPFGRVRTA